MNDRFKFRAYNKELRKMYEIDTICPYEDNHTNGGEVFLKGIQYNSFYFPEEVEVMQCTGLKDKNGKLIYEGDMVRFKDGNDILVINYQKEMACFAPQFYCNGKYGGRLWFDDYDSFECQFYKSNNFEIIGNIYQNPELLED